MASIAIDFGTSNCSANVARSDGILPVHLEGQSFMLPSVVFTARREIALRQIESIEFSKRLRSARAEQTRSREKGGTAIDDEQLKKSIIDAMRREAADEANKAYWDQTFFSMLKSGQAAIFGTPALHANFSDPTGGVLMRSPKSFLGSDIKHEYLLQFEDVVTAMLDHIKRLAETESDCEITKALIGRPVRYHGKQGEHGNEQALKLMTKAACRAGFKDIRFELEPLAAAYEYESTIPNDQTILVIDVGGGTTDCVMVRIGPTRMNSPSRENDVLGVSGDRIGGTDFDELLAWSAFMPAFGKDALTTNGFPIPHSILYDAISVRDLPAQLRFRSARYDIENLMKQSANPERLARLQTLHQGQLQHRLIHSAELGKIALSKISKCTVPLKYIEEKLAIPINGNSLADSTSRLVDKIRVLAADVIASAGIKPDAVFMTGGMAISPIVSAAIEGIAGKDIPINSSDMLGTVGRGLGLCAQRVFEA